MDCEQRGKLRPVNSKPFPQGFFDRADPSADSRFYSQPRMVTHIDDHAIAAVGALYDELGISATCSI